MFRVLLCSLGLGLLASSQLSSAQEVPKFPQQNHVTTAAHVKHFWVRNLLWETRVTRNNSSKQCKRRLIKEIEAGLHDDYALLLALRSNQAYLAFHRRRQELELTKAKIAALLNPPPVAEAVVWPEPGLDPIERGGPLASLPTQAKPEPEVIYEEVEICPPEQLEEPVVAVRPRPTQRPFLSPLRFKPWPVGQRPNQSRYPNRHANPRTTYPGHVEANPTPVRRSSRTISPPSQPSISEPEPDPTSSPSPPSARPSRPAAPCPPSPPQRSDPRLVPHSHPVKR